MKLVSFKLYQPRDIKCTLDLAALGHIVFRVSEKKNDKEKVIIDFKLLIQELLLCQN